MDKYSISWGLHPPRLVASQRLHLLRPSHWALGPQHVILGEHKPLDHSTNIKEISWVLYFVFCYAHIFWSRHGDSGLCFSWNVQVWHQLTRSLWFRDSRCTWREPTGQYWTEHCCSALRRVDIGRRSNPAVVTPAERMRVPLSRPQAHADAVGHGSAPCSLGTIWGRRGQG